MRNLSFDQMENLRGGTTVYAYDDASIDEFDARQSLCENKNAMKFVDTVAFVAGIGSFFGLPGALIFGPTAIGMGGLSLYCTYR